GERLAGVGGGHVVRGDLVDPRLVVVDYSPGLRRSGGLEVHAVEDGLDVGHRGLLIPGAAPIRAGRPPNGSGQNGTSLVGPPRAIRCMCRPISLTRSIRSRRSSWARPRAQVRTSSDLPSRSASARWRVTTLAMAWSRVTPGPHGSRAAAFSACVHGSSSGAVVRAD